MNRRVHVSLGPRSYDILIGAGLLRSAAEALRPVIRGSRCVIITDEHVAPVHLAPLQQSLAEERIALSEIVLPAGEHTKSFQHLEGLLNELLDRRVDRATTLLAMGGGVVGDLVGVSASLLLRGLDYVQIPTTLLAQVDSSVGGKTAINTKHGKNLVGSFYQPRFVLADVDTLSTLPHRELIAGYAETVKYGLIDDLAFFDWCEDNHADLLAGSNEARAHAVETSCRAKARIVGADEREAGERALLNLGHTFAHAFESAAGYKRQLLHGEAVAIGCCLAFDLSVQLGLCPLADAERVRRHFGCAGLPTHLPAESRHWRADDLVDRMHQDKKASQGRPVFVLARGIGRAFVAADTPLELVKQLLDKAIHVAANGV